VIKGAVEDAGLECVRADEIHQTDDRRLTLEDCRTTIAELVDAIGPPERWVASEHDALLAE
jgi:hypothetical protein